MGDLISRQAAIDALETVGYDFSNSGLSEIELEEVCEAVGDVRQDMISMIKRLPSAEPETRLVAEVTLTKDQIQDAVDKAVEKIRVEMEEAERRTDE